MTGTGSDKNSDILLSHTYGSVLRHKAAGGQIVFGVSMRLSKDWGLVAYNSYAYTI